MRLFIRLDLFYICTVVNMDDMPKYSVTIVQMPKKNIEPSFKTANTVTRLQASNEYRIIITVIINKRERTRYTHTLSGVSNTQFGTNCIFYNGFLCIQVFKCRGGCLGFSTIKSFKFTRQYNQSDRFSQVISIILFSISGDFVKCFYVCKVSF